MTDLPSAWLAERHKALTELDMAWARKRSPPDFSDEVLLAGMHKARYELKSMPDALRQESRTWLEAHGYQRWQQQPWPIDKELPK